MSKPGLSFGLGLKKSSSKLAPTKRKPTTFGSDDEGADDETTKQKESKGVQIEVITELKSFGSIPAPQDALDKKKPKARNGTTPTLLRPPLPSKSGKSNPAAVSQFGDLSSALESRRYAEAAENLDPSIYDYDEVYDSLKPKNRLGKEEGETDSEKKRRPKYMGSLLSAAVVRERDRLIAEEKRLARERETEGEEYADKAKFVTEAYRRQQEESRRLEEEEKRREEEEARKNKNKGMMGFYKEMLERDELRHVEMMKALEEAKKNGPKEKGDEGKDKERTEDDIAKEIIEKGGKITINEDGQIVDKRELLKGGLNVAAKKKAEVQQEKSRLASEMSNRDPGKTGVFATGGKQAMRERQSRMLEQQMEESLKRARDEEEEERKKIELVSKSRKTEAEISSAKERYLARKRAAEEAKKKGEVDDP